jgi:hypothetical protein
VSEQTIVSARVMDDSRPQYESPTITVVSDDEVLRAFQLTASQIGAAAVGWSARGAAC